jgi:hypothetical protein
MAVRSALRAGRPLPSSPRKIPGTHFCYRLSVPQDHSGAGSIRSIEEFSDLGIRTRDLPARSIMSQPTTLPRAPAVNLKYSNRKKGPKNKMNNATQVGYLHSHWIFRPLASFTIVDHFRGEASLTTNPQHGRPGVTFRLNATRRLV